MLFSRDPHDNNVLLLEQFPSDVGILLDIIADNPETITNPNLTITQCLRLYQMADEYELHSALRQQIYLLIGRHIIENPFEALAVACKREKLDMELACLAIKSFHLVPPSGLSKASRHVYKQTQYATSWIDLMNPANWTVHYIERCGPLAFSSYIGAYLENCCTPKGVVQQAASEEQRAKLMAKVAITFKSRYLERLPRIF
ncbi:hypothetical protein QFC19_008780 [Naganishia cerealis]|uniref:Uncharacterized protein n=1 Tax=Naganishia cerealis TaxID=610337 RepID=A0ACC2UYU6_9TREE|nr:hypothetical protein QFC19_008780 [Naganishia cerealis]